MRVKNTIFTALAAGIIFLSGMVILGKNAVVKPEAMNNKIDKWNRTAKVTCEQVAKGDKQVKSDLLLLQMIGCLTLNNTNAKVDDRADLFLNRKDEWEYVMPCEVRREILNFGEKQQHRIREPSVNLIYTIERSDGG